MKVKPSLAALSQSELVAYRYCGYIHSHIEDTVADDLSVNADLVDTLGQCPDDRVGGPETAHSQYML